MPERDSKELLMLIMPVRLNSWDNNHKKL
jgi:hypothetical protein